jgi:membrane protein DedA with SNARE-associated domain
MPQLFQSLHPGRGCDHSIQQMENILFHTVEELLGMVRSLIIGQPLLFVLVTGLIVALLSVLGEIIMYWVARLGGRSLVQRFARWLRLDMRHMERAEAMFVRWGVGLVVFGRVLPGVRTLVSVPAGVTRMNFGLFFGAAFGGAYLWNTLLVGVSYLLGIKLTLFGISIL